MGLKIIVDQVPGIRIIATGFSSFELAGQVGEPLTGRKCTLVLTIIAQSELLASINQFELREKLAGFLIFGSYAEEMRASTRGQRIEIVAISLAISLSETANSYLLKDILSFDRVKSSRTLLQARDDPSLMISAFHFDQRKIARQEAAQEDLRTQTIPALPVNAAPAGKILPIQPVSGCCQQDIPIPVCCLALEGVSHLSRRNSELILAIPRPLRRI